MHLATDQVQRCLTSMIVNELLFQHDMAKYILLFPTLFSNQSHFEIFHRQRNFEKHQKTVSGKSIMRSKADEHICIRSEHIKCQQNTKLYRRKYRS